MMCKVLIVDDSKLARMSIAKALATLQPSWSAIEVANGDEAMRRLAEGGIDIVLLDFNMPGRDGLELATELHQLKPTMPMALITANVQTEIVARAQAIGAAFLPKPLSQQALAEFLTAAQARLNMAAG
jgi:CheY-like chemotaxis protein